MAGLSLQKIFSYLFRNKALRRHRGVVLRAAICWAIGLTILVFDERDNYDYRYQFRSAIPIHTQTLIIDGNPLDFSINEIIARLQSASPARVGFQASYENDIVAQKLQHTKLPANWIWADGVRVSTPNGYRTLRLLPDPDLRHRRYNTRIAKDFVQDLTQAEPTQGPRLINFVGDQSAFQILNLHEIMKDDGLLEKVSNRHLLITDMSRSPIVSTPIGTMTQAELTANIIENHLSNRQILRLNDWTYRALLLILLSFTVWLMIILPQTASFLVFTAIGFVICVASVLSFDYFNLWVPLISPIAQMFATFIIFTSFRLAIEERDHWRLSQRTKNIQEIEQLKSNFVSLFSHDLKTPIAKIQAIADRMMAENYDSKIEPDLKALRRSSDELHSYIQKILHISRVESRQIKLRKEVADINDLMENVVQRLQPLADEKNIRLIQNFSPLFSVEVDTVLLEEVILNLVDNAIKYSDENAKIWLATKETEECIQVTISDEGCGISPKDQERVWDKFSRGRGDNAGMKGFGLGLYLARYFIELHRGEITLSSELGLGTTVTFLIPFDVDPPKPSSSEMNSTDLLTFSKSEYRNPEWNA